MGEHCAGGWLCALPMRSKESKLMASGKQASHANAVQLRC